MRKFLFLFIAILLFSCNNHKIPTIESSTKTSAPDSIKINAWIIRSFDSINMDKEKIKFLEVKLSVVNKSSKSVSFWTMTCSWEENFIINNDYIKFCLFACTRNFPRTYHLNPNDSILYRAFLIKRDNSMYQEVESTKFGFIYIDSLRCYNSDDFRRIIGDKSEQSKVFWSNPLFLKNKFK